MPIRVRTPEVVIEVDNEQELDIVLRSLSKKQQSFPIETNETSSPSTDEGFVAEVDDRDLLRRFLTLTKARQGESGRRQWRALELLANANGPVPDETLKQAIGIESNLELAGVMSGFSKQIRIHGLNRDQVYRQRRSRPNEAGKYVYEITSRLRQIYKEVYGTQAQGT